MSYASNFGFSKDPLFAGLTNSSNVNATNTNYSGNFSSNEIPKGPHSVAGVSNNVAAAAASKGGGGGFKRKINNLVRKYKMKSRRYKRRTNRRRTHRRRTNRRRTRLYRGGENLSYMSNNPSSTTAGIATIPVGPGTGNPIAMANPPTFSKLFPLPGQMKGGSCGMCNAPHGMKGGSCGMCNGMRGGAGSLFDSAPTIPCNGTGNNYNHYTGKCVGPLSS